MEQLEQTHSPYGKMYGGAAKIALTFKWMNGETIHTLYLYN